MFDELSGVDMFITAQLALIDLSEQTLTVANAGHCPLLLTNNEGETTQVSPDGMPLGIVPETEFADQVLGLEKAHSVLLYTDGLTEARNPEGEWFGRERLIEWLRNATNASLNAKELSDDFLKELGRFQSSATIKDDQTFLILRSEKSTSATTRPMHLAGMAPALF
jgi:sigma-B regulation protein RsbU (phosphoserine phosphatase)